MNRKILSDVLKCYAYLKSISRMQLQLHHLNILSSISLPLDIPLVVHPTEFSPANSNLKEVLQIQRNREDARHSVWYDTIFPFRCIRVMIGSSLAPYSVSECQYGCASFTFGPNPDTSLDIGEGDFESDYDSSCSPRKGWSTEETFPLGRGSLSNALYGLVPFLSDQYFLAPIRRPILKRDHSL